MTTARLALALLAMAFATSAQAQTANRAWVSGGGTDAPGCGAPTAACRSFQYVHDHIIAAGGEIDVLDGAGYGAVTITKSLSIVGGGGVAAVQQPALGGNAITVNAGAGDAVRLRGLTLEGLGVASNGVLFNTGASLDIVGCVIRHFTVAGVQFASSTAASEASITNTVASDNDVGIAIAPAASVRVAMKDIVANDNTLGGIDLEADVAGVSIVASVIDSEVNGDGGAGVFSNGDASGASVRASLRNVTATNEEVGVHTGESAGGSSQLAIGRSLLAGDMFGADDHFEGGTIFSFRDNRFNGNGTDVAGSLTAIAAR
jgi:hypothetical protein